MRICSVWFTLSKINEMLKSSILFLGVFVAVYTYVYIDIMI